MRSLCIATILHCEQCCARENVWVKDMPMLEEMWSSQLVLGRPFEHLHEWSGISMSGNTADAGTSWLNLAMWPNNPNWYARAMLMMLSKPDVAATVTFGMQSFHLIETILCSHCIWNAWNLAHMRLLSIHVSQP